MFDLQNINFADKILSVIIAILQAVLIAIVTKILLDRAFKEQRLIGKNLQEYGIKKVRANSEGTLSKSAREIAFGLNGKLCPSNLDICFISGRRFFQDFQTNTGYLSRLMQKGCRIRVLLANPYRGTFKDYLVEDYSESNALDTLTDYYYQILTHQSQAASFLERTYAMLISAKVQSDNSYIVNKNSLKKCLNDFGDHNYQVKDIEQICNNLKESAKNGGSIELRFYEDEYQMPIIIAKTFVDTKHEEKNEERVFLWTNINAPIRQTHESINILCTTDSDEIHNKTFINDVCNSFEYLWNLYGETREH